MNKERLALALFEYSWYSILVLLLFSSFSIILFLKVSRLNGSYRLAVISTGLDKPRAIVLYPRKGLMFWTDWGRVAKIQKAYMDGSNQTSLISNDSERVIWPNGLTIDYETNLLYWVDGRLNLVGCMDFNGGMINFSLCC